jgi:hypothetical protein
MSSFNPSSRVSATVALDRLKVLKSQTPCQVLLQVKEVELSAYHLIPRSFCRTLSEIISAGQLRLACWFVWASFRKWWVSLSSSSYLFLHSSRLHVGSKKMDWEFASRNLPCFVVSGYHVQSGLGGLEVLIRNPTQHPYFFFYVFIFVPWYRDHSTDHFHLHTSLTYTERFPVLHLSRLRFRVTSEVRISLTIFRTI